MDTNEVNSTAAPDNKLKVLIFGYKEFSQLMSSVLDSYRALAEFRIVDAIVGTSFEIQAHIASFKPDVVVSAGSNAHYLKSALTIPVVSLETTEDDVLFALRAAAQVADEVHFVSFAKRSVAAELASTHLQTKIEQTIYVTPDQAREQFYIAAKNDNVAFVGASLVCGLAAGRDIPSFLVYSADSCRRTLDIALEKAQLWRNQQDQKALLTWLTDKSKTPIIMIDSDDESIVLNQAARRDLNLSKTVAEDLDALVHPEGGQRQSDGECEVNGSEWWFHLDTVDQDVSKKFIYQLYKKQPKTVHAQLAPKANKKHKLVYQSKQLDAVLKQAKAFSSSPSNVLLFGESGTGKELVARRIHQMGPYQQGKFVALNCSAIPSELFEGELFGHQDGAYTGSKRGGRKGLIEEAQGGALFLDEISELALDQQAKLLRFLQERSFRPLGGNQERDVDLKLIAASNRSIKDMVQQGAFREDLFYRLNVFNITIPPLRARTADIAAISYAKLNELALRYGLTIAPEQILQTIEPALVQYHWPGNIRELENVLERVVAYLHSVKDVSELSWALEHIAPELKHNNKTAPNGVLRSKEQELILATLEKWLGDKHKAAQELGISHTTLWRRLKEIQQNND
ncbi:MAG: sigma 54-interacting transcriptional regulator [Alteromonas sp.]